MYSFAVTNNATFLREKNQGLKKVSVMSIINWT